MVGEGLFDRDPLYQKLRCSVQEGTYSYECLMIGPDGECAKSFPTHQELIIHSWNVHLDREDPTQCPFKMGKKCLAKFSEKTKAGLIRHMRLFHGSKFLKLLTNYTKVVSE